MLLHKISILDCTSSFEIESHSEEIEEILDIISDIPDYHCLLNIRRISESIEEEVLICHLHQIPEIYEVEDFTHGADFEIGDSNVLMLTMYGDSVEIDGQLQLSRTVYQILPYTGDIRNLDTVEFIDISSRFVSSESLCFSSLVTWKN